MKTFGGNPGTGARSLTQGTALLHTYQEEARGWSLWCLDKSGLGCYAICNVSHGFNDSVEEEFNFPRLLHQQDTTQTVGLASCYSIWVRSVGCMRG